MSTRPAKLALIAGVFIAGIGTRSLIDRDPALPGPTAAPSATSPDRPLETTDDRAGASGDAGEAPPDRSEAGALHAGVRYATGAQEWLYLDDAALAAAMDDMAVPAMRAEVTEQVLAEVGLARDALAEASGPVWFVARPLATRVQSYRADVAVVDVWVVTMLSASDVAVPQSAWRITTLELRWDADRWRVATIAERPGPTPQLDRSDSPWLPEQLDEALDGFTRVGAKPAS